MSHSFALTETNRGRPKRLAGSKWKPTQNRQRSCLAVLSEADERLLFPGLHLAMQDQLFLGQGRTEKRVRGMQPVRPFEEHSNVRPIPYILTLIEELEQRRNFEVIAAIFGRPVRERVTVVLQLDPDLHKLQR